MMWPLRKIPAPASQDRTGFKNRFWVGHGLSRAAKTCPKCGLCNSHRGLAFRILRAFETSSGGRSAFCNNKVGAAAYGFAVFSNSALRCTLLPAVTFNLRSQLWNPAFFTVTV